MSTVEETRLLAEGMAAAKAGDRARARELLTQVITINTRNELAWLWMSSILETPAQRRDCLVRVLIINPSNEIAQRGIVALDAQTASANPAAPTQDQVAGAPIGLPVTCPFCQAQTDGHLLDCTACGENVILSCPSCDKPINLWETTRCPCGEGLRHYIFVPEGIDHEGLGQRYAMAERWEAAARQWDRALKEGSHVSMLHRKLAQAYEKIGRGQEAEYHRQVADG